MNTIVKVSVLVVCLFAATAVESSNIKLEEYFSVNKIMNVVSIDQKSNDARAEIFCKINEHPDGYTMIEEGSGNYGSYKNINWVSRGDFVFHDGLMRLNKSIKEITNGQGVVLETITKSFDHANDVATFRKQNQKGEIILEQEFPISGPIVDDKNLVHFIRGIYRTGEIRNYTSFYLLTSEPRLYKVNTKYITEELLNLPSGDQSAIKLQLMADLGPLSEIAAKVVAPTYVWLAKEYPHGWLQYQGLESGRHSAKIKSYVLEHGDDDK
jgi:hypothetical protein